jgi:ribosomal protein S27E
MEIKHKIGDLVWVSSGRTTQVFVTCPDCGGNRHIKLTMYDGTEHTIDCGRCSSGFNPPSGRVYYYEYKATAKKGLVCAIELDSDRVEYRVDFYDGHRYCVKDCDIFNDESAALARAEVIEREHNAEQISRIQKKEKDTRTWAWHVSYHRKQIKDAEKSIEYHTSKLNAAKTHVKSEQRP